MRADTPPVLQVPYRSMVRDVRDMTRVFERCRASVGPIATVRIGRSRLVPPLVLVMDHAGAHELLVTQADHFDKEMPFFIEFQRLLGLSSFSMENERWTPRRRALQPVMNRRHVDGFAAHMQAAAEGAIESWPTAGTVELTDFGRAVTLDVIGRCLFSLDLAGRRSTVVPALQRSLGRITLRGLAPMPLPNWMRLPRSWRDRALLYRTVKEAIDLAAARREAQATDGTLASEPGGELVDLLLGTTDPETGRPLDRDAIADELLTFLGAGHDTTATALAAGLWLLARHPEIQDRVRDEAVALGEQLDASDLDRLPYTRQVLDEVMRLYPPGVAIGRTCTSDARIQGYRIPAGWSAAASIWGIHRDPDVYPDPDVFDPERFAPSAVAARPKCAYMPFGAGRRACSGAHFATMEAVIALAVILRRFRISSDLPSLTVRTPMTLNVEPPVHATVTRLGQPSAATVRPPPDNAAITQHVQAPGR